MLNQARRRTVEFQARLKEANIDIAIITDESSIAYLAGLWGYLSVEFGRPTFLLVSPNEVPVVITPLMESEMVSAMTWVEDVMTWEDMGENRWENILKQGIDKLSPSVRKVRLGVEREALPTIVRNWFDKAMAGVALENISGQLGHIGNFQGSCTFSYAANNTSFCGFSATAPQGRQFRVWPDHRLGFAALAS